MSAAVQARPATVASELDAWEADCAAELARLAECTEAEARGLMEAQPFELARLWGLGVAAPSAATVLNFVSLADPGGWAAAVRRSLQEVHGFRPDHAAVLMVDRFETLQVLRRERFTAEGAASHLVFCVDLAVHR